ncbi:hypothetical protein FHS29_007381 [Saccharothrix tamanrassetensis]|uniref:Uncharacterized protein n=1 Tax=Saccharothrix tamanrassetensis TaxID=1051531 RepID=A0A841CVA0_9PSEU|nr:hypothetical protein [Saccharothrix tamanrassetensis]
MVQPARDAGVCPRDTYNGALADLRLGVSARTGNRYSFTGGNPISRVEIDGHCWAWDFICDTGEAIGDATDAVGDAADATFDYLGDHIDDIGGVFGGAALAVGGGALAVISSPLLLAPVACGTGVLCAPGLAGGALGLAGVLTGGTIAVGGVAMFAESLGGMFDSSSSSSTPPNEMAPEPPNIEKGNWWGRYEAELWRQGKLRLPDDWDAHHAIPQEYRNHPEFKDFDFDAPSNIRASGAMWRDHHRLIEGIACTLRH